jgi:hypothetical protein
MIQLRWVLCALLGLPAALLIMLNWADMVRWMKAHRAGQGFSFAPPYLCGITGAAACLLCPVSQVHYLAWCPLVLDPSILGGVIYIRTILLLRKLRTRHADTRHDG